MSKVFRMACWLTVAALALLFAVTVWPTLYLYDHTWCFQAGPPCVVRINRVTGSVDMLHPPWIGGSAGWWRLGVSWDLADDWKTISPAQTPFDLDAFDAARKKNEDARRK